VREIAAIVQGGIQGKGAAGISAEDLAVEVLLGSLAGADEAERNGAAFAMVFPVGQGGGLDHVFHVLRAWVGTIEAAAGAVGSLAAGDEPFGLGGQVVRAHLDLLSSVM
jgi:hypothetical protein